MRAALLADQQTIAIGEIARIAGLAMGRYLPAIGVLRTPRRNALRNDPARRVLAEMDHLGAAIDLLHPVGHGNRIELAARIIAPQNAAWIFPRNRRTRLNLRPADLGIGTAAIAALGHEIIDAAFAIRIARIPILHRRIFDLGIIHRHKFDDSGMQLVFIALRRGAALKIGHIGALLGDNERTLELAGILLVDPEIGRQFHRAPHAFGDVDERPIGKHGAV